MIKAKILAEIIRTAKANGGSPLGVRRFHAETGIAPAEWLGKFWARWSDALAEAGYRPNQLQGALADEEILEKLADLARELQRFPVAMEIRLRARRDPDFPWHNTVSRLGRKGELARKLFEFSIARKDNEVAEICRPLVEKAASDLASSPPAGAASVGYVYLVQHGKRREYKIGRTNNPIRREGEISLQLPEQLDPLHYIKTDDPAGVEAYWHQRFATKRKKGEWFGLTQADVAAFRRWKRIY
jgi:hypothetical protein